MKSIKLRISLAIIICSLIGTAAISVLSIYNSRKLAVNDAKKELDLTCSAAGGEANALISRVEQSVDTLSDLALARLDFSKMQNNDAYVTQYTNELMDDFVKFAEHTDGAITAYIRYNPDFTDPTSGIFLSRSDTNSSFESLEPTDFSVYDKDDLAHVGWYYIPVANKAPLWMDPYLNENINIYMISYVVPLYVDGTSVGIIGMDIDFNRLTSIADGAKVFTSGYSFLTSESGAVVSHKELEAGTDLDSYGDGSLSTLKAYLADPANASSSLEYRYNGTKKTAAFAVLKNGMRLVMTAPYKEITAEADAFSLQTDICMVIVVLFAAVLGFLLSRSIARPITQISDIVKQTAQLDFTKSAHGDKLKKRKDETGKMAQAVSDMRGVLRTLIQDMEDVKDKLSTNMEALDSVMQENNSISEDNSATTEELAAGMEETGASTAMIVDNITAIQSHVKDIRELSEKEQQESKEIMNRARRLKDTTSDSNDKAMEIYDSMRKKTDEAIEQSKVVAKINELTENIRNISSQTNLLALNANIEAARAGEAGRGFAVVATEIGALASQTFQAVDDINQIVGEVNAAVDNMTQCIEVIMEFLDGTVVPDYGSFKEVGVKYEEDANNFTSSMVDIHGKISELSQKIDDISMAIENVNDTIAQSAEGVNLIAEKSGEAVNKTSEGYEKLNENKESLERLKELIGRFHM